MTSRARLETFNTPWLPCFVAMALCLLLAGRTLLQANFNPTVFINAGSLRADANVLGPDFIVNEGGGYDGQFYYRLSLDPFTSTRTAHGITLDSAPYRHQRILYPFLSWCLTAGQKQWIPWAMIGINTLAFCALGWIAGWWAQHFHRHAFWGLLIVFHVGFLFSYLNNVAEILQMSLMLWGLSFYIRQRWFAAALLLTLSVLTKETVLPLIIFLMLPALPFLGLHKTWLQINRRQLAFLFLPLLAYITIQMVLRQVWHVAPVFANTQNLAFPLRTVASIAVDALRAPDPKSLFMPFQLSLCLCYILLVSTQLKTSSVPLNLKMAWAFFAAFFVSLGIIVLDFDMHFMRAFSETYLLGALILMTSSRRVRSVALCCVVLAWSYRASTLI